MSLISDYLNDMQKSNGSPNDVGLSEEKLSLIKPTDNFFVSPINPRQNNLKRSEDTFLENEKNLLKINHKGSFNKNKIPSVSNTINSHLEKTSPTYNTNPTNELSVCSLDDLKKLKKKRRQEKLKLRVEEIVENLISGKYENKTFNKKSSDINTSNIINNQSKIGSVYNKTQTEKQDTAYDAFKIFDPKVSIDNNLLNDPNNRSKFRSYNLQLRCFGNEAYRTNFLKGVYDFREGKYFRIHSRYNVENFQNVEKNTYQRMYDKFVDKNYFNSEKNLCFSTDNNKRFKSYKEAREKMKNYTMIHMAMRDKKYQNLLNKNVDNKTEERKEIKIKEKDSEEDSEESSEENKKIKEKEMILPDIYEGKTIEEKVNICYDLAMELTKLPQKRDETFKKLFPDFKRAKDKVE